MSTQPRTVEDHAVRVGTYAPDTRCELCNHSLADKGPPASVSNDVAAAIRNGPVPVPPGVIDGLGRACGKAIAMVQAARPAPPDGEFVPRAELTDLREAAECCINLFNENEKNDSARTQQSVHRLRAAFSAACAIGEKLEES